MLIIPTDHHIAEVDAFHEAQARGVDAASDGAFVTFGIRPKHAATGFGYIELESADVASAPFVPGLRFLEKPPREAAEAYLAGGRHM